MADRTVASAAADLRLSDAKIPADIAAAKAKLLTAIRQMERDTVLAIGVRFDSRQAEQQVARFRGQLSDVVVDVRVDTTKALTELGAVRDLTTSLDADDVTVSVDTRGVQGAVEQLSLFGALVDEIEADDLTVNVETRGLATATSEVVALGVATDAVEAKNAPHTGGTSGRGIGAVAGAAASIITPVVAGTAAVAALGIGISVFGVKASATLEQTVKAFENILGSAEDAEELFGRIQDLADISPFETQTLADATKSLLAIGVASEEVIPTVENLAGIVSLLGGASAANFGRLTLALGQVRSSMRPMTQDLYQIQNALPGFNAKLQLAAGVTELFGITTEEAMQVLEDGGITGEQAFDILLERMNEFPGAATAIAAQADTLQGKLSTFSDVVKRQLVTSFLPITELIKETLPDITVAVEDALGNIAPALGRSFEGLLGKVAPLITDLGEALGPAFEGVFTGLGTALEGLVPVLAEVLPLLGEVLPIVGEIAASLGPAVAGAVQALGGALIPTLQLFSDVLEAIPTPVLTVIIEAITGLVVATKVAKGVGDLSKAVNGLGESMKFLGLSTSASLGVIGLAAVAITGLLVVMGQKAARDAEIKARTDEVTDALLTNYDAFTQNTGAMVAAQTQAGATAAAFDLLGTSIAGAGEGGEKLNLALNNLGLSTDPRSIVETLNQIGAFGDPDGDLSRVPGLVERVNQAFGAQFGKQILDIVSDTNSLDTALNKTRLTIEKDLTPAQRGLIESLEELQDQSENTDIAAFATEFLQLQAAMSPTFEIALQGAEAFLEVSRFTTDAADAQELLEEALKRNGQEIDGEANRFRNLRDAVNPIPAKYGSVAEAVADLGRVTEEELGRAEQATKDFTDAIDTLLGRLDLDIAKQNFFADLEALVSGFTSTDFDDEEGGASLIQTIKDQAAFAGLSLFDFFVTAPTPEARQAFQDAIDPLIREGAGVIQATLEQEGGPAAALIAADYRQKVVDALLLSGVDPATALLLAQRYFPGPAIEELAHDTAINAADVLVTDIEKNTDGIEITPRVSADTAEARASIDALDDNPVTVTVVADTVQAANDILEKFRNLFPTVRPRIDPSINFAVPIADGGIIDFFHSGGIRTEQHYAQVVPAGTWRVWAEPETGGEAYIPLAQAKRGRSLDVLDRVAQMFDREVVPAGTVARVADGRAGAGGGAGRLFTRAEMQELARTIAAEMPVPVHAEYRGETVDINALAEILFAKMNRRLTKGLR